MSLLQAKIEAERERIAASDIGDGHKEALSDMLIAAYHASNGAPDKMQALTEAVAALAIGTARDAIHRREDIAAIISDALEAHRGSCVLAVRVAPSSWAAKVSAWVAAIKPVAWPLALATFSPFAGDILVKLAGVLSK